MASNARTQQLLESAAQGDVEKVRSLLRAGVGINEQHHMNGWTALHWYVKARVLLAFSPSDCLPIFTNCFFVLDKKNIHRAFH